jgi:hypothetical protein
VPQSLSGRGYRCSRACALTNHRAMKACWGSGGTAPRILNLGGEGKSPFPVPFSAPKYFAIANFLAEMNTLLKKNCNYGYSTLRYQTSYRVICTHIQTVLSGSRTEVRDITRALFVHRFATPVVCGAHWIVYFRFGDG